MYRACSPADKESTINKGELLWVCRMMNSALFCVVFLERYKTQTIDQSCWNPIASRVNEKTCPGAHNNFQAKSALESLKCIFYSFYYQFFPVY